MTTVRLKYRAGFIAGQAPKGELVRHVEDDVGGVNFIQGNAEFGVEHPSPHLTVIDPPKIAPPGSLLVSVRAPVGALNLCNETLAIGRGVAAVVPRDNYDSRFLWWVFHSIRNSLKARAVGSTYDAVTVSDLADLPVPDLELEEQQRISAFLDRECKRIQNLSADLVGFMGAGTRLALSQLAESVTDIPATRVGYMFDVQLGKMLDEKRHGHGELRPYLRNTNVQWDRIDLDDLKEMTFLPNELVRFSVRHGDLLVCEGGDPGRCAIWSETEGMCFQKALLRVRPHGNASVRYLFWMLRLCHSRGDFRADGTGSTILHLPAERLRALSVPLPDATTQESLARLADDTAGNATKFDEEVSALRDKLTEYRDALITEAVTGRLDVSQVANSQMEESLAAVSEGEEPEVLV